MTEPANPTRAVRDDAGVRRFIERFASVMVDSGVPRMPSRVFAALMATDSGAMNAAELSEVLQVSPAAISGAVRYLTHVQMISRERDPGTRRDVFRVHDFVFEGLVQGRDNLLRQWERSLAEGMAALGEDTPAGRRLGYSVELLEFMRRELLDMMERWHEHRAKLEAERTGIG